MSTQASSPGVSTYVVGNTYILGRSYVRLVKFVRPLKAIVERVAGRKKGEQFTTKLASLQEATVRAWS